MRQAPRQEGWHPHILPGSVVDRTRGFTNGGPPQQLVNAATVADRTTCLAGYQKKGLEPIPLQGIRDPPRVCARMATARAAATSGPVRPCSPPRPVGLERGRGGLSQGVAGMRAQVKRTAHTTMLVLLGIATLAATTVGVTTLAGAESRLGPGPPPPKPTGSAACTVHHSSMVSWHHMPAEETELSTQWVSDVQPLLRPPNPELALRVPAAALGAGRFGQPTQQIIETPPPRRVHHAHSEAEETQRQAAQQDEMVFDEGKGLSTKEQQYDPTSIINEVRQNVDSWRALPNPSQWQVTPGNGAPAPALAASQVQRHPPVLLPGGSGRNRHLADRGRAPIQERQAIARPPGERQQGRQPRTHAPSR